MLILEIHYDNPENKQGTLFKKCFNYFSSVLVKRKCISIQIILETPPPPQEFQVLLQIALRTVPTKYKGLCSILRPYGKSKSLQELLESRSKKGVATHFFEINSLESQRRDVDIEGKDISSQISLEFALTYRKANT